MKSCVIQPLNLLSVNALKSSLEQNLTRGCEKNSFRNTTTKQPIGLDCEIDPSLFGSWPVTANSNEC